MTIGKRIGFIGTGKMATALARGLSSAGVATAETMIGSDPLPEARERFTAETGVPAGPSNADVLDRAEVVVLAVKPQQMNDVLAEVSDRATDAHLFVSIAAGVPIGTLMAGLGDDRRIVRVMPNTPCLVGAGAAGFALGGEATDEDAETVEQLLSTVGLAVRLPEKHLDAVTGLSGGGPAYVYQIVEALSDGGVRTGLPRDVATRLAAQTVLGAAQMILETGEHPAVLKDAVASPGGTTMAGLYALERGGLRACLMDAVDAATVRSRELGRTE